MAKLIKPLTAVQIKNAKPKEALYKLFDGGGLFLQVNPTGGKYWKMKYRKDNGKEGLLTFGKYPAVSLEQARKKRDEARSQKAAGLDPAEAKRQEKEERVSRYKNTFEAVALAWMDVHSTKVTPQTMNNHRRILKKHVFPSIGAIPIKNLKAPNFLEMLRRIEATGYLFMAKRSRILCSLVMRYAVAIGIVEFDPLPSLRGSLKVPVAKHRAAVLDPKELGRILRAIDTYGGSFIVLCALKMLPYLFVRPGELYKACWEEINFDTCEWRYTTHKTGTPHIVPLSSSVMALLKQLHSLTGQGEYVFPAIYKKEGTINKGTIHFAMRHVGIQKEMACPHGFRATARTLLEEVLEERYDLIEHQLAHTVRDPNGRAYNRTQHLPERKRMMERWAMYLDNLRAGIDEIPPFAPAGSKPNHKNGITKAYYEKEKYYDHEHF
jgi:integrase